MTERSTDSGVLSSAEQITLPLHGYGLFFFLVWWPVYRLGGRALGIDVDTVASRGALAFMVLTIAALVGLFLVSWGRRGGHITLDQSAQTLSWTRPSRRVAAPLTWRLDDVVDVSEMPWWQPAGVRIRVPGHTFAVRLAREDVREVVALVRERPACCAGSPLAASVDAAHIEERRA